MKNSLIILIIINYNKQKKKIKYSCSDIETRILHVWGLDKSQ